jgi:hypothetical protein
MVGTHPRTSCRRLFKKLDILTVPRQYTYSLMSFFIGNQEKFQTNSSVHNINTRNKHHLHRPVANLSRFQKGVSYSGIRIFNSLPWSITNLKNEKTQFKVALKKFLNAHSFYSVDELFICTDDMYCWLYICVNVPYPVIFLLFVCWWHVPHPIVLWFSRIYGMHICMYVCIREIKMNTQGCTVLYVVVIKLPKLPSSGRPKYKGIHHTIILMYWYCIANRRKAEEKKIKVAQTQIT